MAEIETLMGVDAGDIEKIMVVEKDDIEKIMGLEVPSGPAWVGARGILWARAESGTAGDDTILYRTIGAASGNASDFGDMNAAGSSGGTISSGTRGVHGGGYYNPSSTNWYGTDKIEYITIASTGNGTDFGNLHETGYYGQGASSNGTLGTIFGGMWTPRNYINSITIASAGDASDVGDLTVARGDIAGVCSATMSIHGGGNKFGLSNEIDYTSWGSLGDASDFGDFTVTGTRRTSGEDSSRGIFYGAYTSNTPNTTDNIDYIGTASTGNASDFGNTLSLAYHSSWGSDLGGTHEGAGMSNGVRLDVGGGRTEGSSGYAETAKLQYITIASAGDASDYSDDIDDWGGDGASAGVQGTSGN